MHGLPRRKKIPLFRRAPEAAVRPEAAETGDRRRVHLPQPRRDRRTGRMHVLRQRRLPPGLQHSREEHRRTARRRNILPQGEVSQGRKVPRLFPGIFKHLRPGFKAEGALPRSALASRSLRNSHRHPPGLRGRAEAGHDSGTGSTPDRGRRPLRQTHRQD